MKKRKNIKNKIKAKKLKKKKLLIVFQKEKDLTINKTIKKYRDQANIIMHKIGIKGLIIFIMWLYDRFIFTFFSWFIIKYIDICIIIYIYIKINI
jgi:hypothetical protein